MRSQWKNVGPKWNMTGVLIRKGEKTRRQSQTSGEDEVMTGRDWSNASISQETSEIKRKPSARFFPRAFRENMVFLTP